MLTGSAAAAVAAAAEEANCFARYQVAGGADVELLQSLTRAVN